VTVTEAELVKVLSDSKPLVDQGVLSDLDVRAIVFTWKEEVDDDAITLHWLVRDETVAAILSQVDNDFEPWWVEEVWRIVDGKAESLQYLMREDAGRHLLAMEDERLLVHLWQKGYLATHG
jgi:hypothetical protein